MGLFDKFKDKVEPANNIKKTQNYLNISNDLGFCRCGNVTDQKRCAICGTNIREPKIFSPNEINQIWFDKILTHLSEKYNVDFNQISLNNYFNLNEKQESHIIYRLIRAVIFEECEDICILFEDILKETKNNDDMVQSIVNSIKERIINDFYNGGFKYTRSININSSEYKIIETPIIKDKHSTGTKVLATAVAGPLGFVATSGIEQTMEVKRKAVPGQYLHYEYLFTPESIRVKSDRAYNKLETGNVSHKIIVKWEDIEYIDDENSLILKTGEVVQIYPPLLSDEINKSLFDIAGTLNGRDNSALKLKIYGKIKKETSLFLSDMLKEYLSKTNPKVDNDNQIKQNTANSLENLVKMYEKGLLTDDEFIAMKKKLK